MLKRSILKFIILLIILFNFGLIIFIKVNNKSDVSLIDGKEIAIVEKATYTYDINYKEKYKNEIYEFEQKVSSVDYEIYNSSEILYGKMFIGKDDKLYISNDIINVNYLMLNEKIKTMYIYVNKDSKGCYTYVITEDGKLYRVGLRNPVINNSSMIIEEIKFDSHVVAFVNLKMKVYLNDVSDNVVVLLENNKMYYLLNKWEYNENDINVENKYIIHEDDKITTSDGRKLVDSKRNDYIAKYIIISNDKINSLRYSPDILIVTEENKLIYMINDNVLYEYPYDVKKVKKNDTIINIEFVNNKSIDVLGYNNSQLYGIS